MAKREQISEKVKRYIESYDMIKSGDRIIVGVSGGSDSLCLLKLLSQLFSDSIEICVVHINHMLRECAGEEAAYVKSVCDTMNLECRVVTLDVKGYAEEHGIGTEEAGRELRYRTFRETGAGLWKDSDYKIAVAHNKEDNAETVLLNVFRGADLAGICGIEPVRGNLIRPILCLSKRETQDYLEEKGIKYCVDESNLGDEYARNRVRHHILSYASQNINEGAVSNIFNLSDNMSLLKDYIDFEIQKYFEKYVILKDGNVIISDNLIADAHSYIVMSVLYKAMEIVCGRRKDIERKHIRILADFLSADNGKMLDLPYRVTAYKRECRVELKKKEARCDEKKAESFNETLIIGPGDVLRIKGCTISAQLVEAKAVNDIPKEKYTKWFDYDKISNVMTVRKREEGDVIVIDDKGSHQKLKKYFISEKIPEKERDGIMLLADGGSIMWVIGRRIGCDYKVTETTKRILKIKVFFEEEEIDE